MRQYRQQYRCLVNKRAKEREGSKRYRQTAKGAAMTRKNNQRRIKIGKRNLGHVETPELAARINAHIVQSVRQVRHQQCEAYAAFTRLTNGTKAQGDPHGAVSAPSAP